jgi:glycine cleavage system aminomethyltransferase T
MVRGKDAARLLDRVMTRDVARSQPGQVLYTPWCDGAGKVLDDGTVTRLDEETFRVTSAEPNLRWFQDNAFGLAVAVKDISESIAALALQGPTSRAILEQACDADLARLKYFRMTAAKLRGVPVTITRTGYTGDLGYEIWMDAGDALAVWDALIEAGTPYGITPAGMLALDVARIEAGLMLLDVDYVPANKALIESQTSSPFELDIGWAVSLDKDSSSASRRSPGGETWPEWQFVGVQVAGTRSKRYLESGSRPGTGCRVAHERPALCRRRAGGLRYERRVVADPQSLPGARAPPVALGDAGNRARDGGDGGAPAQARRGAGGEEAVLRPGAEARIAPSRLRIRLMLTSAS